MRLSPVAPVLALMLAACSGPEAAATGGDPRFH